MRRELDIFFAGLMFYTRIPIPKWVNHHPKYLNKATKYFPLIGWLVGLITVFTLWLSGLFFPFSVALLISMAVSILVTGAFHEDGFSDVCDGFGGGWTQGRILEIMKDSRIGVFGAVGLVFMLGGKFLTLSELGKSEAILALLIAHPLSRLMTVFTIYLSKYVQQDKQSKAKPIATNKPKINELVLASIFGLLPLLIWASFIKIIVVILFVLLLRWLLSIFFTKWIGGYTGDCLGAIQQVCEVAIYLALLAKTPHLFE